MMQKFCLVIGITLTAVSAVLGQVPRTMSYQGVLTDADGNPVPDGNYNFVFRLYLAESGGDPIWEETQMVVISGGLFDVILGRVNPLDLPFDRPYYLGISVDGEREMSPRIPLSASPYSLTARTVADSAVTGEKIARGQVVRSVNGLTDEVFLAAEGGATITTRGDTIVINAGGGTGPDAWSLTGNAGTNPTENFLGTTDEQALELRVNSQRALRIEPGTSPNLIGGFSGNSVTAGVVGATIAGGGAPDDGSGGPDNNRVTDDYGTVGGGRGNQAGNGDTNPANASYATVAGGVGNTATGMWTTVGGGRGNSASTNYATVGGGFINTASGNSATVGGGIDNDASGSAATVPGGSRNTAAGDYSFAAGRRAKALHDGTFVWADCNGIPCSLYGADFVSTGPNQFLIRASGGVGIGTNSPQAQLHVQKAIDAPATLANHVAIIENTSSTTNNGPDVLALKTSATNNPGASTNFITFFDGNNNSLGAIQGDGSGGIALAGPGNDYAEWLPLRNPAESVQAGDIVAWTPRGITLHTGQALRLMVVSTQPIVTGNTPMNEDRSGWAPVAFVGQVPVRVRGPVQAGDFILPSGNNDGSGVGVSPDELRADQVGRVVGRALESAEGAGLHWVKVLVGLPHNDILQVLLRQRDAQLAQQQARLEALEAENAQLRVQMRNLEARLEALEREVLDHATSAAVDHK